MAKEWCVEGVKIKLSANNLPVTGGTIQITTPASSRLKAKDKNGAFKGVYFGAVTLTFVGTSWNGYTQTAPGSITFNLSPTDAKAKYSKEQNQPILIKEDSAQTLAPVAYAMGQTTTTLTVKAEIDDPMQTYVKEK